MNMPVLEVINLELLSPGSDSENRTNLLRDITFSIDRGQAVGITGVSGSGKSTLLSTLIGMVDPNLVSRGTVRFSGKKLIDGGTPDGAAQSLLRGREIALVQQNPFDSFHPMYRVKRQVNEHFRTHQRLSASAVKAKTHKTLLEAGLVDAKEIGRKYPHQLSGGEAQRVCLAQALISDPEILLADEILSAVDPQTERDLVAALHKRVKAGMTLLLCTHNLALLNDLCERVVVLHDGSVVEKGSTEQVLTRPNHPRSKALVAAERQLRKNHG